MGGTGPAWGPAGSMQGLAEGMAPWVHPAQEVGSKSSGLSGQFLESGGCLVLGGHSLGLSDEHL